MKKKKEVKPKPQISKEIIPIPSDLEEFQGTYGGDWIQIVRSPAFIAATQLLNIRKLKSITNLSDDQIEKNGREILSDLRGHLQHEDDLFTLHDKREFKFPLEEETEYMSPEQAAEFQQQIEKFREQHKKTYYAAT